MLSKEAMEVVIRQDTSYLNDDCWLGDMFNGTRITRGHSEDFRQFAGSPSKDNTIITSHLSYISNSFGVPYTAKFMYDEHKKWIDSGGTLDLSVALPKERALRWKRRL